MATREFNSEYVNELAAQASEGLQNRIHNDWKSECERQYEYTLKSYNGKWNQFWVKLGRGDKAPPPFEEYLEDRKCWLYSEYSTTYTLWREHKEGFQKTENLIDRIGQLADFNDRAGKLTRLDDSEYNTLVRYAAVTRK